MPKQIWDFLYENWKAVVIFGMITIGGVIFLASKQFGFTVATTITEKNVEIGNMTYDKYDGTKLEGSDVINAIKRHQKQLPVTVYTGESVDTYKGSFTAAGNDRKSEKYIKPSMVYYGSLLQDKNKEVIGLVFAKEGVQLTDTSYKELIAGIVGGNAEDSTMEELIGKLADAVNGKDAALADLKKKLEALNSSMGNLQTEKTTLTNQINSLTSQLENEKKKYNTLNNEVSSGKSLIANAITAKGVSTTASSTYNLMAGNIAKISSDGMPCKEYQFNNNEIRKGDGLYFTIITEGMIPELVVIETDMYLSASTGASNIGKYVITSTKYSEGEYTMVGPTHLEGRITFSKNEVVVNTSMAMIYTGDYYLTKDGTTSVKVYGRNK